MVLLANELAAPCKYKPHVIADRPAALRRARAHRARTARARARAAIVVNNAGFGLHGAAAELDRAEQLAMIDLNVRALTDLSLRWIDGIARHKGGILNVASVAGFLPGPGMAVYYASKAYVLSFTEALSRELEPLGVRVTALCPGPVPTEFQARAGVDRTAAVRACSAQTAEQVAEAGYDGFMAGKPAGGAGLRQQDRELLPRLAAARRRCSRRIAAYQRGRGRKADGWQQRPSQIASRQLLVEPAMALKLLVNRLGFDMR